MTDVWSPPEGLTTIRDYIRWGASRFTSAGLTFGHGTDNALDEAAALVMQALHMPPSFPGEYLGSVISPEERLAVVGLINRRIQERRPNAYLTKQAMFAGHSFFVDERVLVPRSPIAELIEQRFDPWLESSNVTHILDLCTGSACIAIACALMFPDAQVDGTDISKDALDVAAVNVKQHDVKDRVHLIESDLFSGLPDHKYELIVSNPPYVRRAEWESLAEEYHAEPKLGFYGGETGLDCVHRILSEAGRWLAENGILIVEVGSSAETLQKFYPDIPFLWLDFERGGDGVFLLTAEQLDVFRFEDPGLLGTT